jgi:death-on-curing protein
VTVFNRIGEAVVGAIHEAQRAEHGGYAGVRDAGLLDSALARPRNLAAYGTPDAADCAAAYGFGIARNHPFIDGNKRTAFVCVELFLALNGCRLEAGDAVGRGRTDSSNSRRVPRRRGHAEARAAAG